ncbi:indole-3-glycerol-phosphate synthase [Leptospira wolffii]|uniref:indole-3-glycerol-phosphate synthase n=1 Tax=Leptospira wolffii TaxID=409998 RepID=UPI00108465A8|nr:indole-3-glycerol-phosphate synthase [Leptospira wolffii]TGK55134.1 indole-3-glycerol-phosphate synthase [Leptospira wolffii]TGK67267.1 indole-3-glycerol-phosphate synthase [Leptospira wolffii]TGK70565.1 indole-3-glycerol-phosphate synthase [Leptospira wolffii]TGL29898.1 indole-3-glycerol-phosphate synthase [Leptospira wolffii]
MMALHRVLQEIVDTKKKEIEQIPKYEPEPYKGLGLWQSLRSRKFSIIAECKKKSPSSGIIREEYDSLSVAKVYSECGASAISVLTDRNYFGGSLEDLRTVSSELHIPILRKDFILDESQILEAREFGAAAILLIVRILSPDRLASLIKFSRSLNMDVLTEIHTEEEADIASKAGANIVGINTRDLDDFSIHKELVPKIAGKLSPNIVKVGESGVKNKADLDEFRPYVDAGLVGTYFMEKSDIRKAWLELF